LFGLWAALKGQDIIMSRRSLADLKHYHNHNFGEWDDSFSQMRSAFANFDLQSIRL
jgi:hypothetical protein